MRQWVHNSPDLAAAPFKKVLGTLVVAAAAAIEVDKCLQLVRPAGVAKLAQSFGFNPVLFMDAL